MSGLNTLLNATPFNQSSSSDDFGIFSFFNGTEIESFALSEAPLIIQYLDGAALAGGLLNLSSLQISPGLGSTAYSGERELVLTFTTDPYYYHSDANNNFSFFCEYVAPVGNVNLVFPDTPCAAFASFEGYSGELSFVTELLTADLYQFWEGSTADVSLATYRLLGSIDAYSGEYSIAGVLTSALFAPIAYSGEYSVVSTITLPVRAELSSDAYTGENIESTLSVTIGLDLYHYTGEYSDASLKPTQYADYIKTEGPSAYWKMDEQTGTSAIDYTGNNSPATYTNGPILANASPVASKYAVYLDGSNDIIVGNPTSVVSANLTQELWVKPDAGATITLYTPSSTGTQGVTGQRYAVYPRQSGSGSGGGISVGSNGIQVVAHGDAYLPILLSYQQPISTTEFTHILVSWNDRTPTLYVNGVAVATGYQARAQFNSQGLPQSGVYGYYKGYMQDVAIYPTALTADQAREHYLAGIGLHFIPRFEPVPAYTGQYVDPIEFTIDPHANFGDINIADGGTGIAGLQANIRFYSDAYTGEYGYISHDYLTIVPNSTFSHFHGAASHSQTSTCLTLNSLTSSAANAGINAYFALPQQLENNKDITFRFKRTKSTTWYDDDFTDAGLWFCFFPNYTPASITFATWSWGYDCPNYWGFSRALIIRMRNTTSGAIRVNWIGPSGEVTNNLTVISNWTTTELNGTDLCSIVIRGSSSNTIFTVYGKNNAVRQSGTFSNMANPFNNGLTETTDTFLIHYHNYTTGNSEILCDMAIGTYEGIILVPFTELGVTQAYSGETAAPDNLYTSVIFELPVYAGENYLTVLTTYPSIDLGTVTHYASETLSLVLLTSSIIDAPAYAGENNLVTFTTFPSAGLGIFQANSGEREDLVLSTFSLLYAEARGGEAGVADLYVNPFDQIDSDARSGERGDFDLYTVSAIEAIAATGDSSTASLDVHPSIPLTVSAYAGGYVDPILLVTSSVFALPAYAGELNSVTFTTFVGEQLTLPFYAGSRGDLLLSTVNLLSAQAYADQYSDATLTVFYASALVPVAYSDQYSDATLRTQDALNPLAYSDQNAYATLTVALAIPMSATAYAGSRGSLDLQLGITFPAIAYEGARLFFDIEYVVNLGMPLPAYAGENALVADMATTYNLPSIGYAGETGLVNLGVEYAVEIIGRAGSRGYADLTLNPPDLIAGVAYSGQYLSSLSLSTRTLLPNIGYSGEGTVVTLTDNPAAPLLLMNYGGQAVIASVQTATQLPIGRHYSGEWANVIGMTNEPHWYMVTGTHCVATLATSVAIPITMYEGQRGSLTYDTHPSEPLGMFYFRPGEWMTPGLEVLYSANFRVLYRTSIMTQVDIRSATYFDLTTDECCGERPQSNNLMFIIEKGMYPEEVGYGNRTYMTVDLRCNPRMKVEFPTGHVAELIDNVDYFEITFSQISHQIELDWFADLRHKLCKGYFIPTGNWVVVELNDILPEDCYVDRFYGGETFSCALSDDIVLLVPDNGTGAFFSASLETKPPWLLQAYSGEKLTFDFPWEAKHTYYSGERLSIGFYEAPINVYAGASAEFEIHTEYGIRFLEEGCFDNEFVYQNDDGDTIPELFNPVPVEGEPFAHSVRAECF